MHHLGRVTRSATFGSAPPRFDGGKKSPLTNVIDYDPFSMVEHRKIGGLPVEPLQLHPFRTADDPLQISHSINDERVVGSVTAKGELPFATPPAKEPSTVWFSARPFLPVIVTKTTLGVGYEGEEIEVRTDFYNYNNDVLILATPDTRKAFLNWRRQKVVRTPEMQMELARKRMFFDFWWALFNARLDFRRAFVGLRHRTDRQPQSPTLLEPITKREIASELFDKKRIVCDPKRLYFYPPEEEVVWKPHRFSVWYVFPEGSGDGCEEAVMDTEKVRVECTHHWEEDISPWWKGGWEHAQHDTPLPNTKFTHHHIDNWKLNKGPRDGDHLSLQMYNNSHTALSRHQQFNVGGHRPTPQMGYNSILPAGVKKPAALRKMGR